MRTLVFLLGFAVLATSCNKNFKAVRKTYARDLNCPAEKVIVLDLPGSHPKNGEQWLAYGCEQRRLCFDDNTRGEWACRWADDLLQAAARLKLETNCPTEQMKPVAYTEQGRAPSMDDDGNEWEWQGGAYRIEACGKHYVCNVNNNGAACGPAVDLAQQNLPNGAPPAPVR
jgi:hypothetical protein